jgi:hypothetical protein
MSYTYNNKKNVTYYVNLNNYTKGRFGNTNFIPFLSDPIEQNVISYNLDDYDSLIKKDKTVNKNDNYACFTNAYQKPICEICSKNCK